MASLAAPKFAAWQPAGRCTSGAGSGARALMAALLQTDKALKNWGIYNCRKTALGNSSAHGEGRALDIGCSVAVGKRLVRLLRKVGPSRLGISVIIHNRVIMSAKSPNGRRYPGVPHLDHVHIEMLRSAAAKLNLATIRRVLGSSPTKDTPAPKRKLGSRVLKEGMKGADVKALQRKLNATVGTRLKIDGEYGPATTKAVAKFKKQHDLEVDGAHAGKAFFLKLAA